MTKPSHVFSPLVRDGELLPIDGAITHPSANGPRESSSSILKSGDEPLIRCMDNWAGGRLIRVVAEHDPESTERLHAEFRMRNQLDPRWAAVPVTLARYAGRDALVLCDPGGVLLASVSGKSFDPAAFLKFAEALSATVCACHTAGLVHGDLNPSHILVDVDSSRSWLTGFGNRQREVDIADPDFAYKAPEQTGCVSGEVDERTDLYALGCIFYEMLTGQRPPLHCADAAMHAHVDPHPATLASCFTGMPCQFAAILMKMLARRPEDRYQSACSLTADLSRCRSSYPADQAVASFPLDLKSIGRKFKKPRKLYGRTSELRVLTSSFERVAATGKPEFILLTGYSGSGKTSLVGNHILQLENTPHCYATGKCDPLKAAVPYYALVQAFQTLLRPIVGESDERFQATRAKLIDALGINAGALASLVPCAAVILGNLPPVPELTPELERLRFLRLTTQLLNAFATPECPLILFFDDLQWADAGTLAVIQHLITDAQVSYVSVVAAYRDTGAQSSSIRRWINETRNHMVVVPTRPLRATDLAEFISDTLTCTISVAIPIARFVESKTGGEPFFAIRLLASLADEGLISFDYVAGKWLWNPGRAEEVCQPNNIADFMRRRIANLSNEAQLDLRYLSCVENASADTLSAAAGTEPDDALSSLIEAERVDLVYQHASDWRFWHDRVREAVYASISAADKQRMHLEIGRRLAASPTFDQHSDQVFVVVNQINRGLPLVRAIDERVSFGRLNLVAGRRARNTAEHVSALEYFVAATRLLSGTRESSDRDAAEFHRAECEFLTGAATVALSRLTRLKYHFLDLGLRTQVTRLLLTILTARDQLDDALGVAVNYLHQAGEQLPKRPTDDDVDREFERVITLMSGRQPHALFELPLMRNVQLRSIMEVYVDFFPVALLCDRNLRDLVLLRMTSISLRHGHCDASTHAYAGVVRALGVRYGDYETGIQFGELAMRLIGSKYLGSMKVRAQVTVGSCVLPWSKPIRQAESLVREAVRSASLIGDLNFEVYSRRNLVSILIFSGTPIRQALAEADAGFDVARKYNIDLMADSFMTQICMLRELCGMPVDEASLLTAGYDPHWVSRIVRNPALSRSLAAFAFWTHQMQVSLTFGDFRAALAAESAARKHAWTSDSLVEIVDYSCYGALAHAEALLASSPAIIPEHVVALYARHNTLAAWVRYCPENFRCRLALVEAQIACIEKRFCNAECLFEEAINDAQQHGFVQIEALAAEAAARHYTRRRLDTVARSYLSHARDAYLSLGAQGKVHAMDSTWRREPGSLIVDEPRAAQRWAAPGADSEPEPQSPYASSGEIVLSKLAGMIVTSSVEFAGAQRGVLAFFNGTELRTAATAYVTRDGVALSMSPSDVSARDMPATILQTVARTREHVVVGDALQHREFAQDPYILSNQPRSIVCMPIVQQARTTGILYLENCMATAVFTPEKVEVLVALATQAAVTFENARLCTRLAEESRQRDRAVDALRDSQNELARVKPLITMRELVASVVHEVAQPFATVGAAAGAALNWLSAAQPDIGQARSMVEQIVEQSARGRSIVRSLRALVSNATPSFELFDINASIDEILAQSQSRLCEARVELDARSLSEERLVYGDRVQLQQVVLNLVFNAIDAMVGLNGSRRVLTISTSGTVTGDVVIAVEDTGPGISPAVDGRLFAPFVTTKREGLGMGLAICSMIVEAHGGKLAVEPGSQAGAVFRVSIPGPADCMLDAACG
ncbi:trifunctional serine/threonine-protein kinase/ATP-binding protein/sensor histidine kinase [Paraburkholderia rhizosphaerae]|uniref:histidine kinase n=1 Tax=Paraburkholderia rhizosphaerae TaxID=480658 RepID=A0A4R8M4H3_9BURK|nr:AAA family ATPase [Paraburkholderia rhizosphaerae]TDY54742.1 putative ATPase [Paraburkholderia rhizosphaerae]